MARKSGDDALGVIGTQTIIGAGVVVTGDLASDSDITIDGTLNGQIKADGDVAVGINARIKANIQAANVTIAGTVTGNITASGETHISESGQLRGDITASGLAIDSGGLFIGRSRMESGPKLNPEPPAESEPPADPKPPANPENQPHHGLPTRTRPTS